MKVVIITKNLLAGGAERVISQLVNFWYKQGIICKLVLIEKKEHFYNIPEEIEIIEITKHKKNVLHNKIIKYAEVRKIVKKIKPDVVLSLPEEIGIYVLMSLLFTKYPVIVSERNDPWKMPYKKTTRFLRLIMYPFAKGIIFQFDNAATYFPKFIQKKGKVLPNPLDISRFEGIHHENKLFKRIISAGRLEKQKNFPLLINAFQRIRNKYPEYTLVIFGDGNERRNIEQHIKELHMEKCIMLPGKTSKLLQEMANSDLFVLSSDYEGVPNVVIEALAVGTPTISTNCSPGGAASIIKDGENGLLVEVNDIDELAKKMDRVLSNSELSNKLSYEGIKIRQELDIEKVGQLWLTYLKNICDIKEKNERE